MAVSHLIIIGNIISFIAALFMFASGWTKDRDRTFLYQILENLVLCAANACFRSWAGISTLLLSGVRNYLVMKERYTKKLMYVFVILIIVIGTAINNRGLVGLLPVAATVQLSICNQYAKTLIQHKLSLFVNTAIWLVYDFCILDISSTVAQTVMCLLTAVTMIQLKKDGVKTIENSLKNR